LSTGVPESQAEAPSANACVVRMDSGSLPISLSLSLSWYLYFPYSDHCWGLRIIIFVPKSGGWGLRGWVRRLWNSPGLHGGKYRNWFSRPKPLARKVSYRSTVNKFDTLPRGQESQVVANGKFLFRSSHSMLYSIMMSIDGFIVMFRKWLASHRMIPLFF
jgi:hypothetical protein